MHEAGGIQNVAKHFLKFKNLAKRIPFNAYLRIEISKSAFKSDDIKNKKWLSVIWNNNQKGLQNVIREGINVTANDPTVNTNFTCEPSQNE